ncbi:MAG TPA: winged helix DNA-binding domain-containing protein [Ilumatobacteraceae bacterium]
MSTSTSRRRCNGSGDCRRSTRRPATSGCGTASAISPRDSLTTALHDRSVVQATLMRSTIHMVAADDFWSMCAGIRESRREWWLRIAKSRRLPDIDYDAVARVLREVLADGPRPRLDLVAALERAGYPKPVWEGAGSWVELVRVPPSGTWERRRADRYGLGEQWVPPTDASEVDGLRLLLTRYLQAFGPANLADAATWAGVPRSRVEPVAASMDLITYRDEAGAALVDLGNAALTDPDVRAPVRLLPTWDATLLAHCRHAAILPEHHRQAIFHTKNPQSVGTVLVDGAVAATWAWRTDHIEIGELSKLTAKQRREVDAEAERLAAFYRA